MQKTILITGCSSGIGLCAAETLHKRGYRVFATVRKEADGEALKAQSIEVLLMDMEDEASLQKGVAELLAKTGGTLDALFNNAGFAVPGAVEDMTLPWLRKQFETNVFGPVVLANLIIPVMRQQGHGRIINNTSILGVVTMPFRGAYNASKFALEGFTSTLRQELRGSPIHVSIIAPGPIETNFRVNAAKSYYATLKNSNSVHKATYEAMENSFKEPSMAEKKVTSQPSDVVAHLIDALESKNPKTRYYVGMTAHVFAFLRRILPDSALDWIMAYSLRR
jgi:NAD(P)-dependent dehydrogenase (short-subunit alcohol dehydrogenase family)